MCVVCAYDTIIVCIVFMPSTLGVGTRQYRERRTERKGVKDATANGNKNKLIKISISAVVQTLWRCQVGNTKCMLRLSVCVCVYLSPSLCVCVCECNGHQEQRSNQAPLMLSACWQNLCSSCCFSHGPIMTEFSAAALCVCVRVRLRVLDAILLHCIAAALGQRYYL